MLAADQLILKFGPGHAWHGDIQDQATGVIQAIRREEKPRRSQKVQPQSRRI